MITYLNKNIIAEPSSSRPLREAQTLEVWSTTEEDTENTSMDYTMASVLGAGQTLGIIGGGTMAKAIIFRLFDLGMKMHLKKCITSFLMLSPSSASIRNWYICSRFQVYWIQLL
jgi:hypothetical protein